jgi:hypothetical protein
MYVQGDSPLHVRNFTYAGNAFAANAFPSVLDGLSVSGASNIS